MGERQLQSRLEHGIGESELSEFCDWVKSRSHLFRGVTFGTMLRDDAYKFVRLGTFVERADNTARLLDVKYHLLLPATVSVTTRYVASAAPLAQGQKLGSADLVLREGDLASLPPGVLTDLAQAQGRTLQMPLAAGMPLSRTQLKSQPVVQQGQPVRLVANGNGFSVSGEGRALTSGAERPGAGTHRQRPTGGRGGAGRWCVVGSLLTKARLMGSLSSTMLATDGQTGLPGLFANAVG